MPIRVLSALLLGSLPAAASAQYPDAADNRWTNTIRNGGGLQQGDATTLTWGFVDDGTSIFGAAGEPTSGSDLISFLDANVGSTAINNATGVYSQKDWFQYFESYHERYAGLSGLSYEYVTFDDGAQLNGSSATFGVNNVRPDVRIGGHFIDGQSGTNTLAYNYFPDGGDMVIDTGNVALYSNANNNYRALRNVLAHEHGHGIGQPHVQSSDERFLMEPFIDLSFDGPQFIDVLQTQRGYGDVFEKQDNGAGNPLGNDALSIATSLGVVPGGGMIELGMDAVDAVVGAAETDFFSIDGLTDTDFYEFVLDTAGTLTAILDPLGPVFNIGPQGGTQTLVDFAARMDLRLSLFDGMGTLLGISDVNGAGGQERLDLLLGAGNYFARIDGGSGAVDQAQFYGLSLAFAPAAVPEPGTWALMFVGMAGAAGVRRRRKRAAIAESAAIT